MILMANIGTQLGRVVERERYASEVRTLSLRDELTGLLNRRGFMELGARQHELALSNNRPFTLVFADLIRRRDGLHSTRMRHLWREGDPEDRGATTASTRELERILETAQPAGGIT